MVTRLTKSVAPLWRVKAWTASPISNCSPTLVRLRSSIRPSPSSSRILLGSSPFSSSSLVTSERKPTFTTPEPSSYPNDVEPVHDPTKPLPPTDLPVEDYASPLLHTASFFGNLFRYAVYGSVTIVLIGVGSLVAVHLYVEHIELSSGDSSIEQDPDEWSSEIEGWSGGYLNGGTDPRLGIFARSAIRGAWIAQNWGAGSAPDPLAPSNPSTSMKNPFSNAGGMMIGSSNAQDRHDNFQEALSGGEIRDAGWQLAEEYLVYALNRAEKKGISLVGVEQEGTMNGVDRAALELEQRLAGIRERIGGRYRLDKAREAWEKIYYALSSTTPVPSSDWSQRERLRATRKLGELSARLAEMARPGSEERDLENVKAEGWFLGGILPTLTASSSSAATQRLEVPLIQVEEEQKKSVSPSSSFFGFWSRSHPPTQSTTVAQLSSPSSMRPAINRAVDLIEGGTTRNASPATQRALLSSLISFETFLARRRSLESAYAIQSAALSYVESLMGPSSLPSPSTSGGSKTLTRSTPVTIIGPTLTYHYYSTRAAVLRTHLAEVSLALRLPNIESYALGLLDSATHSCDSTLTELNSSPLAKDSSRKMKAFSKAANGLVRDARVTAVMACNLSGYVVEMGSRINPKGKEETKKWAEGGVLKSLKMFEKAIGFAKDDKGVVVDDKGIRLAESGLDRVKQKAQSLKTIE